MIGHDSAQRIFREHETFSSQLYAGTAANWGPNLLMMDEPEHARYRSLAQPAFALRTMESWHERWLLPTLERLIGALEGLDRCDLYMALCARFPAHTIGAALGISEDETARVHDWIIRTATNMPKEESESAAAKLVEFLQPIVEDRRSTPGDDVISLLVTSELRDEDGSMHRLSDAEVMGFCGLLLIAGTGTTYRATGILMLSVLSRPELLQQVKSDRTLIPRCVEEVLRWEPPPHLVLPLRHRGHRGRRRDPAPGCAGRCRRGRRQPGPPTLERPSPLRPLPGPDLAPGFWPRPPLLHG